MPDPSLPHDDPATPQLEGLRESGAAPGLQAPDFAGLIKVDVPARKEERAQAVQGREDARRFVDEELEGDVAEWAAQEINRVVNVPHIPEAAEGYVLRLILHRAVTLAHQVLSP